MADNTRTDAGAIASLDIIATEFRKELGARLAILRQQALIASQATSREEDQRLLGLLHNLAGTCATLGQPLLAAEAQRLQLAVQRWQTTRPGLTERSALAEEVAKLAPDPGDGTPMSSGLASDRAHSANHHGTQVVIVDDDPAFANAIAAIMAARGYDVTCYHSLSAFSESRSHAAAPDLLLLDLDFPDGPVAGAEVIAGLHAMGLPQVATVCISTHDSMQSRLAAHRAGAGHYLVKPIDGDRLLDLAEELTQYGRDPLKVLLVDNDLYSLEAHRAMLEHAGIEVITSDQPMDVLDLARTHQPDVTVLDVYMPEVSGLEAAAVLRTDESLAWMPVVFLSAEVDARKRARALSYGGDHFLVKPVAPNDLRDTVRARGHRARVIRRMLAHPEGATPGSRFR